MEFIFKIRGHSPGTDRLRTERNSILRPDRLRIVGKGRDNERLQKYRPSQKGGKQIEKLNIEIYNRFFLYCETVSTTPLQEYQQNNHESWLNNSDEESQMSHVQHDKCPTSALKKFKKLESVNLIRLKQTAKLDAMEAEQKEKTTEAIQKAETNFALDLPMLVEETARDVKILNAISALESNQIESIFYHYRHHRSHLSTRFGLLFFN